MPTTTNNGWTTPADTDLVKDGAAAIRTLGNAIDATLGVYSASGADNKNVIINGAFDIWQRGTSSSSSGYLADRWYSALISGTGTFAQETTVKPSNSIYSQKFTASATAQPGIYQAIETLNAVRFAGQTVTVSGKVAASTSVGVTIDVQHSSSTDNSVTGTWTSISPSSGGTATPTSTTFVSISGTYAIPSTARTLRVRVFTTSTIANGVVVYFGECQLEQSATATGFARSANTVAGEYSACQRYYNLNLNCSGWSNTTTQVAFSVPTATLMRSAPSATLINGTSGAIDPGQAFRNITSISATEGANIGGAQLTCIISTTTGSKVHSGMGNVFAWSAEL